ncbi:SDR family NAD(P)-dependent oxidoreductase [Roseomonas sp. AR75]|uniref:SDR family NAD(P)-dependent oxidoreductase n=1 Tax=Roseomonas sp. AR75 TaxID=2562311 RepID=UPI0010C021F2|nr:SDR family oxidoreductase [Roseomonas sp. AR75]
MGRLTGKRALVTGTGTDGMGRAIALGFAREGADIALHHRAEPEQADAVAREIAATGRRARAFAADFSDTAETRRMVRDAADWLGGLDILLSAAGTITRTPFLALTDAEVQHVVGVNLLGTFACAQEAARVMAAAGQGGRLIAISSINQQKGMPLQSHYAASKGGIMQLFRSMALELGPLGITCNLIAPSAVVTDLNRHIMGDAAHQARVAAMIPLGRIGLPQDMVGAAIFLACEESAWMTGTTLHVDGGRGAV